MPDTLYSLPAPASCIPRSLEVLHLALRHLGTTRGPAALLRKTNFACVTCCCCVPPTPPGLRPPSSQPRSVTTTNLLTNSRKLLPEHQQAIADQSRCIRGRRYREQPDQSSVCWAEKVKIGLCGTWRSESFYCFWFCFVLCVCM